MSRTVSLVIVALVAVVGWWLTRDHLLDDALIHAMYALRCNETGRLTFDGLRPSVGVSSLLHMWGVAAFLPWVEGPVAAKLASILGHAGLVVTLVILAFRSVGPPRIAWTFVLCLVLSPFGFRWLADGMETALWCWSSLLVGVLAARAAEHGVSMRVAAVMGLVGFIGALARVELVAAAGVASVALTMARPSWAGLSLLGGALVGWSVTWAVSGAPFSDAAVAKSFGSGYGWTTLSIAARGVMGASLLGVGTLACWAWCSWLVIRARRWPTHLPDVLMAATVPAMWLMIGLRGQQVQGVRPMLWICFLAIGWLAARGWNAAPAGASLRSLGTYAGVLIVVAWAIVDLRLVAPLIKGRSDVLHQMAADRLHRLTGEPFIALDVGFISWFTRGNLCDLNGLVNGRDFARLTQAERAAVCGRWQPTFAFLTEPQRASLQRQLPDLRLGEWVVCRTYDFPNVRSRFPHALLMRPDPRTGADGCARLD